MKWIDRHRRIDEGVTVGMCATVCDQVGTTINTRNIEVLCLTRRPRQCILHWAEIHCSSCRCSSTLGWNSRVMEVGKKELIHGLVTKRSSAGGFKARKAFSF